jgi:hypothetical protein
MRVAHEAPLCIFDIVQQQTDYDYSLVHLFEENVDYFNKFKEAIEKGRHVILDNSVFELEEAFDSDRFLYWINKLGPAEYIIPDVLEDSYSTIQRLGEWLTLYQPQVTSDSKTIGVVQGHDFDDLVYCYEHVAPLVDKIAISFDYSFMCPEKNYTPATRCEVFMRSRQRLIKDLLKANVIDTSKPHHLLGCYSAAEFQAYKDYTWVDTIDTSNPVIAGFFNRKYRRYCNGWGLNSKPMKKLHTIMDSDVTNEQLQLIMHNIEMFRKNIQKS